MLILEGKNSLNIVSTVRKQFFYSVEVEVQLLTRINNMIFNLIDNLSFLLYILLGREMLLR